MFSFYRLMWHGVFGGFEPRFLSGFFRFFRIAPWQSRFLCSRELKRALVNELQA